jgi:hypothetical protein
MSYLSLLLAAKAHGTNPASGASWECESQVVSSEAWPETRRAASSAGEYGLPSGVTSMEHWLDLNA